MNQLEIDRGSIWECVWESSENASGKHLGMCLESIWECVWEASSDVSGKHLRMCRGSIGECIRGA